jgi:proteasome lid subunit RPN8/RPN11
MKSTSFLAARGNLTFDVTGVYRTHPQGAPSFSQPDFRTTVGSVAGKGS